MTTHARLSIASLALVVPLALAPPSQAQTRYTTVDLGSPPNSALSRALQVNDRGEAAGISGSFLTATAWTRDGIFEIGGLVPPNTDSVATGINKRGEVVGHSAFSSGWPFTRHGFLWRDGVLVDLGTLAGATSSLAEGINDHGDIAGTSFSFPFQPHIVLWRDGAIHDLGVLRESDARVTDINNRRQIIGYAIVGSTSRAFTWQDGVFSYLPSLSDAVESFPWSINDRGEIAGSSIAADGSQHAVLWRDGSIVDLGMLPGSRSTAATGINDRGQVVGFASNPDNTNRAFVWEDGRMTELAPPPGSAWAIARAINDHGEIVGFAVDQGYRERAIMWIPMKGR